MPSDVTPEVGFFDRFATKANVYASRAWFFAACVLMVVLWLPSYALFQSLDNRRKFAGAMAAGWNAYNISGDRLTGVGAWTAPELIAFLSTGHAQGRGSDSRPLRMRTIPSSPGPVVVASR